MDLGIRRVLEFVICFLALIVLQHHQSIVWLYLMVAAQGGLVGSDIGHGRDGRGNMSGPEFGGVFGAVDAVGDGRRSGGALGDRRAPRTNWGIIR